MSASHSRALAAAVAAGALSVALVACGHSSSAGDMSGMKGMDMPGMGEEQPSVPKIAAAAASDTGLHGSVGGYSYAADASSPAAGSTFTFHITGPNGTTLTRFQPYEGQLLVFYVVRADLGDFRRLTASMRADGTWTVPMPPLAPGSYRTYVTFAAPDSSAGTPLSYSLSRPLTVPGRASAAAATLPAAAATTTVDGYALRLTGSPHQGAEADLGVSVSKNGKPVQQFDRLLDGYAHLTAFHSGDAAFARGLSTGRSAGGAAGAGALTSKILFPERGTWRLFVQFETAGAEHTAAFTVEVP